MMIYDSLEASIFTWLIAISTKAARLIRDLNKYHPVIWLSIVFKFNIFETPESYHIFGRQVPSGLDKQLRWKNIRKKLGKILLYIGYNF